MNNFDCNINNFSISEKPSPFFRRFFQQFAQVEIPSLILMIMYLFYAINSSSTAIEYVISFFLVSIVLLLFFVPTFIHSRNYITNISINDAIMTINYRRFFKEKIIKFDINNLKITYAKNSDFTIAISEITFGQKIGGYNNKIMLTQYLINSWSNKETLLQFCNFLKENNIKTKNFDYLEEQLKKNPKFIP